jgi:pilus assembly protein FimV
MSHGKMAMMLMTALALPRAAGALGLGEIHVESALNEPLAAEIDIVGATDEDLSGITAAIANRDTFLRFGVERPAFLSTAEFKIVRNTAGRAILAVHSKDSFTEPLVDMLVDLRWHGGEMVRQYTLLLDPPGSTPALRQEPAASPSLETTPARVTTAVRALAPAPAAVPERAPTPNLSRTAKPGVIADGAKAPRTITVGARATLRVLARRTGARGDAELTRMMIALFHSNPSAFEGNINRLRRGAVLTVPPASSVAAISIPDARREFRAQMQSWRGGASVAGPARTVAHETPAGSATAAALVEPAAVAAAPALPVSSQDSEAALDRRVQTLEKGLSELQDLLDRERDKLTRVQAAVVHEEKAAAATPDPPRQTSWRTLGWPIAEALALLGAFAAFQFGRRRRPTQARPLGPGAPDSSKAFQADAVVPHPVAAQPPMTTVSSAASAAAAPSEAISYVPAVSPSEDARIEAKLASLGMLEGIDIASLEASYLLDSGREETESAESAADAAETAKLVAVDGAMDPEDANAATMPVETARLPVSEATVETTQLDYNLMDLDSTAHHVQMPSRLHENVGFKERRTSLVDALKLAIEREPNRRDLRMKLLETYYAAAAINRQGFLELVRKLAEERDAAPSDEWDKVLRMGRQIASDNELFAAEISGEDDDLANCA